MKVNSFKSWKMKKNLLIVLCTAFALVSRSQTVIDEKYSGPIVEQNEARPKLIYFIGNMNEDRILLKWNVAENESVNLFEIKKSYDGKNFTTSGFILGSEKRGNETYFFPEILRAEQKIYYRLKIVGNNKKVKYSNVISFQPSPFDKTSVANTNNRINPIAAK